jgi:hypothetical protein
MRPDSALAEEDAEPTAKAVSAMTMDSRIVCTPYRAVALPHPRPWQTLQEVQSSTSLVAIRSRLPSSGWDVFLLATRVPMIGLGNLPQTGQVI